MERLGVDISYIVIEINTDTQAGYLLGVPSDESIKELNDWFFSYDFGEWDAYEFEEVFYTVIHLKLLNKYNDYSNIEGIKNIIKQNAAMILEKYN